MLQGRRELSLDTDGAMEIGKRIELFADDALNETPGGDIGTLAGRPLRLRFAIRDADRYGYRFAKAEAERTVRA
jgi:hypothetical protein